MSSPAEAAAGSGGGTNEASGASPASGRTAPSSGFAAMGDTFTAAPGRGAWMTLPSPM